MDSRALDPDGARALCDLTAKLKLTSDESELAKEIAETAHWVVGADYAQLGLPSDDGASLVLYHGAALDHRAQEEWPVVPLDLDTPVGRVLGSGRALAFQSALELTAQYPVIRAATEASGYESLAVVPIVDPLQPDRCLATLSVAWPGRDRATDRAMATMADLARRCSLALADRRALIADGDGEQVERKRLLAFQQSLLPSLLVEHPRLEIASRFVPSQGALAVGGDWYDTVPVSDGRLAIAVGDVAGHGFGAALGMGQIRNDFEALAAHTAAPSELLAELDRYAGDRKARMATAAVVYVDPDSRELSTVLAGHPPPILLRDRRSYFLEHSLGPPLGANLGRRRGWPDATTTRLGGGEALVLYTDGLVERRGESIDQGIDRLRHLIESVSTADLEAFCDQLVDSMFVGHEARDDVALLVVRFH